MDSPTGTLLFLVSAFGAEVIGTMAGFGAATILTPITTLFLDVKTAIVLVACCHLFGNASRLVFFGRHVQWDLWAQFGLTGVLCSLVGAGLTVRLPAATVSLALGAFLLLYVGVSQCTSGGVRLPRTPATLVGGGVVSGFIAGLIGTGGAIRSACLLAFDLPKERYIGTSAAIALVVDATRLPVYMQGRALPASILPVLLSLLLVAFAGSWVGQRLVRRIAPPVFRRMVLVMLSLMGIKLLMDGWRGLV